MNTNTNSISNTINNSSPTSSSLPKSKLSSTAYSFSTPQESDSSIPLSNSITKSNIYSFSSQPMTESNTNPSSNSTVNRSNIYTFSSQAKMESTSPLSKSNTNRSNLYSFSSDMEEDKVKEMGPSTSPLLSTYSLPLSSSPGLQEGTLTMDTIDTSTSNTFKLTPASFTPPQSPSSSFLSTSGGSGNSNNSNSGTLSASYTQATSYKFGAQPFNEKEFQWEIGEIEETFVPDSSFINSINSLLLSKKLSSLSSNIHTLHNPSTQTSSKQGMMSNFTGLITVDDSDSFLLPQFSSSLSSAFVTPPSHQDSFNMTGNSFNSNSSSTWELFMGPKCIDFRHGAIPELIVSFMDESKLRAELWKLHEIESGIRRLDTQSTLKDFYYKMYLESLYKFVVLGMKDSKSKVNMSGTFANGRITLNNIRSADDFKIPPDVKGLLGKTYRFKGLGTNFAVDRMYIKQKMHEIFTGYGFYVSNILVKIPCKILEGNRELAELSGTELINLKVSQYIQDANILLVAVDKRGITNELSNLLKSTGFCRKILKDSEQYKLVFISSPELDSIRNTSSSINSTSTENIKKPSATSPPTQIYSPNIGIIMNITQSQQLQTNMLYPLPDWEAFKNLVQTQTYQILRNEMIARNINNSNNGGISSTGASFIEKIISEVSILPVRPKLFSLLSQYDSTPVSSFSGTSNNTLNMLTSIYHLYYDKTNELGIARNTSKQEIKSKSCIPAILGTIANAVISKCAESFKELNRNWMNRLSSANASGGVNVNSSFAPLLDRLSLLSVSSASKSDLVKVEKGLNNRLMMDMNFVNNSTSENEVKQINIDSGVLEQLTWTYKDRYNKWTYEIQSKVKQIEAMLIPKARESFIRAQTEWNSVKDKYFSSIEQCRIILSPQHDGVVLGVNLLEFTCRELISSAPAIWYECIGKHVPSKIEEMLNFSTSILKECVSLIEKSHDSNEVEKARLFKLLQFCKSTHERTIFRFSDFKNHLLLSHASLPSVPSSQHQGIINLVREACLEVLHSKLLSRSEAISSNPSTSSSIHYRVAPSAIHNLPPLSLSNSGAISGVKPAVTNSNISGLRQYHDLIIQSLAEIPIAAARNIENKLMEKFQTEMKQMDILEKDLQRAIRCVLVVLKSNTTPVAFSNPSSFSTVDSSSFTFTTPSNSNSATTIGTSVGIDKPINLFSGLFYNDQDVDMHSSSIPDLFLEPQPVQVKDKPTHSIPNLPTGSSGAPIVNAPKLFQRNGWRELLTDNKSNNNLFGISRKSYEEHLKKAGIVGVAVKTDGNCQYRVLAHQVYGTEDAHAVVRLLVLCEILSNPTLYEKFIQSLPSKSVNGNSAEQSYGSSVQEYVSAMSREGEWGDHITLCAFANFFGSDILIYSPLFPSHPILVQSQSSTKPSSDSKVFCVAYLDDNHYQSLVSFSHSTQSVSANQVPNEPWMHFDEKMVTEDISSADSRDAFVPRKVYAKKYRFNGTTTSIRDMPTDMELDIHMSSQQTDSTLKSSKLSNILQPSASEKEMIVRTTTTSNSSTTRKFTPLTLAELSMMKIVEYIDAIPSLNGIIPEELIQVLISQLVEERHLDDSILPRVLDSTMKYLSIPYSTKVTNFKCIPQICRDLKHLNLSNCVLLENDSLTDIATNCPLLEIVKINGCTSISNQPIIDLGRKCNRLTEMDMSGCVKLTDVAITQLCVHAHNLQKLFIQNCNKLTDEAFSCLGENIDTVDALGCELLTDMAISYISLRCKRLRVLKVSSKNITDKAILDICEALKSRSFNSFNYFSSPVTNQNNLLTLEFNGCELLSDASVKDLSSLVSTSRSFMLGSLTLSGCRNITNDAFMNTGQLFNSLEYLDLTRCLSVTDKGVKLIIEQVGKTIKALNLSSCEDISDDSVIYIASNCPNLQEINLSKCMNVTDKSTCLLLVKCTNLTKLILYNCNKITDATVEQITKLPQLALNLKEIDISSCQNVTDDGLQALVRHCPYLQVLFLEECSFSENGMIAMATDNYCFNLHTLKVAYCKGVTDKSLERIAKGCPNIKSIDLSYCTNISVSGIKTCLVNWPKLSSLNLRGLHQISTEGIVHENLHTLNLSWCKNIQDIAIEEIANGCKSLITLDLAWAAKITSNAVHKLAHKLSTLRFLNLRGCAKVTFLAIKYLNNGNIFIFK